MRTEIPLCKRCCFCLPLRYGLIVWGYFRLCVSILLTIDSFYTWNAIYRMYEKYSKGSIVCLGITTFMMIADIALSILFIIACHKKYVKLIKIFYFYSQFMLGLTTALTIYNMITAAISLIEYTMGKESPPLSIWMFVIVNYISYFAHLFLQLYMILLVRSEIIKLNSGCEFRFVNHGTEAQCQLNYNNVSKDNDRTTTQDNEV